MLKFFREIRRKLLDEGQLKRYLVYAIGEILLVMIGILLALQVNNWSARQKENSEREKLYQGLENEFRLAKEMHAAKTQEFSAVHQSALKILKSTGLEPDIFRIHEFDSLLQAALEPVVFNPSFIVYQEVISTNKIELITGPKIKTLLYQYQAVNNDYRIFERVILRDVSEEVIPYLNKHIAFKNLTHPYGIQSSTILKDNRNVLMELEFENLLDNYHYINFLLYKNFEKLGEVMDDLLGELEMRDS